MLPFSKRRAAQRAALKDEAAAVEASVSKRRSALRNQITENTYLRFNLKDLYQEAIWPERTVAPKPFSSVMLVSAEEDNTPLEKLEVELKEAREDLGATVAEVFASSIAQFKTNKTLFDKRLEEFHLLTEGPDLDLEGLKEAHRLAALLDDNVYTLVRFARVLKPIKMYAPTHVECRNELDEALNVDIETLAQKVKDAFKKIDEIARVDSIQAALFKAYAQLSLEYVFSETVRNTLSEDVLASLQRKFLVYRPLSPNVDYTVKALEVKPGSGVYLLPLVASMLPEWRDPADIFDAGELSAAVIETAVGLFQGEAYPRLSDAVNAARVLA